MHLLKKTKLTKQICVFMAIQLLIMLAAVLNWRIHKGNLFLRSFAADEYIVSENAVAAENVTTDETMNEGSDFMSTPGISLKKGTYTVYVSYNANVEDSVAYARSSQVGVLEMRCPDIYLNPAYHTAELSLDLSRNVTDLTVGVTFSGKGYLSITGITIIENTDHYKRNIFRAFVLCLLLNFIRNRRIVSQHFAILLLCDIRTPCQFDRRIVSLAKNLIIHKLIGKLLHKSRFACSLQTFDKIVCSPHC